ncbi:hypothetical protein ScPMuIL_016904 [Solemya velum]
MDILLAVAVVLSIAKVHGSEIAVFELDQSHLTSNLTEAPTREVNQISTIKCAKECNTRERCTYFFYNHECPEGWTMFGYSCYIVVNSTLDWQDSANRCNALGGYLLEIGTEAEQKVIDRLVKVYDYEYAFWIGAKSKEEGLYRWTEGGNMTYTNWYPGEPFGASQCANIAWNWVHTTQWDDVPCYIMSRYICER